MYKSGYPDVDKLVEKLKAQIQKVLGNKLTALYLEGSLVLGDFDEDVSDIDLVAVTDIQISEEEFKNLKKMHDQFAKENPSWYDRIEVCYVTKNALKNIKSSENSVVNISPGEPIHRLNMKKEWIMNWYLTREKGATLFGASPKTIIEPISKSEYIDSVKNHVSLWKDWVKNMKDRYGQAAYTVLTMCRALYAYKNGGQVSKREAALWAQKQLPQWESLINKAFKWREEKNNNPVSKEDFAETANFVNEVRSLILKN